jgi:hypothetical protein
LNLQTAADAFEQFRANAVEHDRNRRGGHAEVFGDFIDADVVAIAKVKDRATATGNFLDTKSQGLAAVFGFGFNLFQRAFETFEYRFAEHDAIARTCAVVLEDAITGDTHGPRDEGPLAIVFVELLGTDLGDFLQDVFDVVRVDNVRADVGRNDRLGVDPEHGEVAHAGDLVVATGTVFARCVVLVSHQH